MLRKLSIEQYAFFIMLIIGSILLGYNIHISPLTADELSAVYRGRFSSLNEVFYQSILDDVHPPLMQFFIFYWLKIVGTNIFLIKLPFLLMGIGSVYMVYKLAKNWFNSNVALLASCFFMSTQVIVMYSQIARPYISGTFLILCFAYQWSKVLKAEYSKTNQVLYVVLGILCAYNHYFTTLQLAIIGLTGLFLIKKTNLLNYILLNGIIALSFIVFLPTMFTQMNYEGINYIPKPDIFYLFDFLGYIFHYSFWPIAAVVIIIGASIILLKKDFINKFHIASFLLFFLPFLIGYLYSIIEKPVMPFRSLIFCFPFLIIFIFSFSIALKKKQTLFLGLLLIVSNTYSLVVEREHYSLFKKGVINGAIEKIVAENPNNKPQIIFDSPPYRIDFHQTKLNSELKIFNLFEKNTSPIEFRDYVNSIDNDEVVAFNIAPNFLSIIQEKYPFYKEVEYGFSFSYYHFSKTKNSVNLSVFDSVRNFNKADLTQHPKNIKLIDKNYYYQFNTEEEWGPSIEIPLGKISSSNYLIIESGLSIMKDNTNNGQLVFEIKDGENVVAWRSSSTEEWIKPNGKWQNIYFSVQLNELIKTQPLSKNLTLNIYFWNSDKQPISIDNFSVKIKKGNKYIYSLLEDFS